MVGAELPMTSDQVIWSEQNRLHIAYDSCTFVDAGANEASTITLGGGATALNVISVNDTVVVLDPAGLESKGIVTAITGTGAAELLQFNLLELHLLQLMDLQLLD
jgi:hypothetical protein